VTILFTRREMDGLIDKPVRELRRFSKKKENTLESP